MNPLISITDIRHLSGFEFESACRTFSSFAPLEGRSGLVRILTRYKMFIDVADVSLVPHLVMDGFWETPVTQCLSAIVKEGDVCVDVGAHMGYFSVLMSALAGGSGRTLAVEPNPTIASLLRLTAGINYPGFEVWEGAVSNETREIEIHIPRQKTGDSSLLVRADSASDSLIKQRVAATTLDQLLLHYRMEKVDVLKIDAEGVEPWIFEGMSNLLRKNNWVKIVMEYSPHLYSDPLAFNTFLLSRFDVYCIRAGFQLDKLDTMSMARLSGMNSHTDLLLVPYGSDMPYAAS